MLGMATEPRQKTDPNKSFSDVEDAFNRLAAILQQQIDVADGRPGQDDHVMHLRKARQAALRGAKLAGEANI